MRDPVELEIFKSLFHSIAEEMGAALRRTAFSPNIKERRDYSCAVFDGLGEVVAMGDHMPVHLGSMPMSVRAAVEKLTLKAGDVAILNDPFLRRHAPAGHHAGGPGFSGQQEAQSAGEAGVLCGFTRTPCRCGRNVCGIHGHLPRDLSRRHTHPSHQTDCRRRAAG